MNNIKRNVIIALVVIFVIGAALSVSDSAPAVIVVPEAPAAVVEAPAPAPVQGLNTPAHVAYWGAMEDVMDVMFDMETMILDGNPEDVFVNCAIAYATFDEALMDSMTYMADPVPVGYEDLDWDLFALFLLQLDIWDACAANDPDTVEELTVFIDPWFDDILDEIERLSGSAI